MEEIQLFNTELMKLDARREHGDIEEVAKITGFTRNTVRIYLSGNAVNTRTAGKILTATREVIRKRTQALLPEAL